MWTAIWHPGILTTAIVTQGLVGVMILMYVLCILHAHVRINKVLNKNQTSYFANNFPIHDGITQSDDTVIVRKLDKILKLTAIFF